MDIAAWIQAISSFVLALLTFFYIRHTKRLVEENSNAFVSIETFGRYGKHKYKINLINYGPGHALNIKVEVGLNSLKKTLEGCNNKLELVQFDGPNVIACGTKGEYTINDIQFIISDNVPIYLSYTNQGGKKFKYEWEYIEKDAKIEFLGTYTNKQKNQFKD